MVFYKVPHSYNYFHPGPLVKEVDSSKGDISTIDYSSLNPGINNDDSI